MLAPGGGDSLVGDEKVDSSGPASPLAMGQLPACISAARPHGPWTAPRRTALKTPAPWPTVTCVSATLAWACPRSIASFFISGDRHLGKPQAAPGPRSRSRCRCPRQWRQRTERADGGRRQPSAFRGARVGQGPKTGHSLKNARQRSFDTSQHVSCTSEQRASDKRCFDPSMAVI